MGLAYQLIQRPPAPHLAGMIVRISAYHATGDARTMHVQTEAAAAILPLIINFGPAYDISLGDGDKAAHLDGFVAGLFAGPVHIRTPAGAESVQIDFTPPGAARFWGGLVADLAGRMVPLDDALGADARRLRQRLGG